MKFVLVTLVCIVLATFPIDSTEVDLVNTALKTGQCSTVGAVVSCETEYISVSVKYKSPQ